jgi:hypothetical protein
MKKEFNEVLKQFKERFMAERSAASPVAAAVAAR